MKTSRYSSLRAFLSKIKSVFLHGFFTLLPIAVTIWILRFVFHLIKSTLAPIYNLEPASFQWFPQSEILITIAVILALGLLFDHLLKEPIKHIEEKILNKIPILRHIYFGVKQFVGVIYPQDKQNYTAIVLVEYPHPGIYAIGFLTSPEVPADRFPGLQGKHYGVFVPNIHLATGQYLVIAAERCTILNISYQEAVSVIISGGIIQPGSLQAQPTQRNT